MLEFFAKPHVNPAHGKERNGNAYKNKISHKSRDRTSRSVFLTRTLWGEDALRGNQIEGREYKKYIKIAPPRRRAFSTTLRITDVDVRALYTCFVILTPSCKSFLAPASDLVSA